LRTLLNEFEAFTSLVELTATGSREVLRIGAVPQAFESILPAAIEIFRQAGGCAIRTTEGTAGELLAQLLAGRLDGVVGRLPNDSTSADIPIHELNFVNLYEESFCIVVSPCHPLTQTDNLNLQLLAEQEWAMQRPSSSVRRTLAEAFLRQGMHLPTPSVETSTYIQNLAIVSTSQMVTAVPYRAAVAHQAMGRIRILNIALGVSPMRVAFIRRRTSDLHAHLQCLQAALLQSVSHDAGDETTPDL